jgi:hypothetical protein
LDETAISDIFAFMAPLEGTVSPCPECICSRVEIGSSREAIAAAGIGVSRETIRNGRTGLAGISRAALVGSDQGPKASGILMTPRSSFAE